MDLVSIGFEIKAKGLEQANKEVDTLLGKVGKLGDKSVKIGADVATKQQLQTIDKTTKALEKQALVGQYLSLGFDKTTANSIASFKQLGASIEQTTDYLLELSNSTAILKQRKEIEQLNKVQQQLRNTQASLLKQQEQQIQLARQAAKYKSEGLTTTSANKLASFELSGASPEQINAYRAALLSAQGGLQEFGKSALEAGNKVGFLNTQVGGIAKYAVLSAVIYGLMTATTDLAIATVRLADEYTTMQNRMRLYIQDAEEVERANRALVKSSIENNVGLGETTKLFVRMQAAMQKQGRDTNELLAITDAFGKAMRIGGATTAEAAAATLQFSQAMASGKLNGDEFRSLTETSVRLLQALSDGSGIASEKLKEFSSAGLLTSDVIANALLKELPKLTEENAKLGTTLDQGANAIVTSFTRMIGEFNEGAGITRFFGEQMVKLAKGMEDTANSAKESGAEFRKFFTDNEATISNFVDLIQMLATVLAVRYVAATTVATAHSLKLAYATSAAGTAATASARNFAIAATAVTAFGNAASKALTFFGGWVGVGLTIAGVAASYLMLKDDALDVNNALTSQATELERTTSEWTKLNAAQKENLKIKVLAQANEATDAVQKQHKVITGMVQALGTQQGMWELHGETLAKVSKGLRDGTTSYDDAITTLKKAGVATDEYVVKMLDEVETYNKLNQTQQQYKKIGDQVGVTVETTGNKAQNATRGVDQLSQATYRLSTNAEIALKALKDLHKELDKEIKNNNQIIQLMSGYGLGSGTATKLNDSVNKLTSTQSAAVEKATEALADYKKAIDSLPDGKDKEQHIANYNAKLQATAEFNLRVEQQRQKALQSLIPTYRKLENQQSAISKIEEDRNNAEKENFSHKILNAETYLNLVRQGVNAEVANIAVQKDYIEMYGTNLAYAKQYYDMQVEIKKLEAQQQNAASNDRQRRIINDAEAINKIYHTNFELSKKIAELGYDVNSDNTRIALAQSLLNALQEQHFSTVANIKDQRDLNKLLAEGHDIEEARFILAASRATALGVGLGQTVENHIANAKLLKQEEEITRQVLITRNLEREKMMLGAAIADNADRAGLILAQQLAANANLTLEDAKRNALLKEVNSTTLEMLKNNILLVDYANHLSDEVISIKEQYSFANDETIRGIALQREYLKIVKAQREEDAKKQENPLGDFSSIDFDVFGDFGNPFESALNGLNQMLAQTERLEGELLTIYKIRADLVNQQDKATDNGDLQLAESLGKQLKQNFKLEDNILDQKKKINKEGFVKGLGLAKSFFDENSKGYKLINGLEAAYQASQIAFQLWQERAIIKEMALSTAATMKKIATEGLLNTVKGIGAVLTQGTGGDVYTAIPRMAAMAAIVAALGVAIGSVSGGGSGSYASFNNEGKGTVFGDSDAVSKSISNSIDLLADNSDKMLPINNAMLRSLRNIESSLGGVANLIIRGEVGEGVATANNSTSTLSKIIKGVGDIGGAVGGAIGGTIAGAFAAGLAGIGGAAALGLGIATGGLGLLLGATIGGDLLNTIVGGIFGKKTQSVTAHGLYGGEQSLGDILSSGFDLKEYADIETKKKSWFSSSTSYSTQFQDASDELKNQFKLIFSNIFDSVLSASSVLDKDANEVTKKLQDFVVNIGKIDTKDLTGEEIQEKLEGVIGAEADRITQAALSGFEGFQQVGEGYYETVVRVASSIELATFYTDKLNLSAIKYTEILNQQGDVAAEILRQSVLLVDNTKDITGGFYDLVNTFEGTAEELYEFVITLQDLQDMLYMTGKDVRYLTTSMILGAGSLEALSEGFDQYFEWLSPSEQAAELTRRLTNEMEVLGVQLPKDVKAFKALLSSIDITTEAGQKLYGSVLALAPEFQELQDALESANEETNALVQSLRDLAEEARKARGETEQPRNLAATRYAYEMYSMMAIQGDTVAAERLVELGQQLMQLSSTYSTTAEEYARDLAMIQNSATVSANLQEQGLGYETGVTYVDPMQLNGVPLLPLTPDGAIETNPTLTTEATTTDMKLDALREDLNAALLAIAKYTQVTAQKLENWDYGDRMLVRVEQDPVDDAIPVASI